MKSLVEPFLRSRCSRHMANSDPDLKWLIITASCQRVAESKSKYLLDVEGSFSSGWYGWQIIAKAANEEGERKSNTYI